MDSIALRIVGPIVMAVLAYLFWQYVERHATEKQQDALLVSIYGITRLGLWVVFATVAQSYVTGSDPLLYYTPMFKHWLAGGVPIRDFFYPYGPLLLPVMLPFYLLSGRSLAGISLFAILAETVAVFLLVKCSSLLRISNTVAQSWIRRAMALYVLNPATLYWTVFQGYHSVAQATYSMAGIYLLLKGYKTAGYALGMYGLAGTKFLAILDWPAMLVATRPRLIKLVYGAVPVVVTYAIFQIITGDIFFPIHYHIGEKSEGNVWFLLTAFANLRNFYSSFPGNRLPMFFFITFFMIGFGLWLRSLRSGLTSFSFESAVGMTTFTMSLFFLFSFYTGNYYVPMLMLQASVIVTCPSVQSPTTIWSLLAISSFSLTGDALWTSFGQPASLGDAISSGPVLLTSLWMLTIIIRMVCFVNLARLGLLVAMNELANADGWRVKHETLTNGVAKC
jgi:hypothetical protein